MENLLDGKLFLSDCERLRKANGVGRPLALAWKAKTIGQQLLLFRENLMGKFFSEKKRKFKDSNNLFRVKTVLSGIK